MFATTNKHDEEEQDITYNKEIEEKDPEEKLMICRSDSGGQPAFEMNGDDMTITEMQICNELSVNGSEPCLVNNEPCSPENVQKEGNKIKCNSPQKRYFRNDGLLCHDRCEKKWKWTSKWKSLFQRQYYCRDGQGKEHICLPDVIRQSAYFARSAPKEVVHNADTIETCIKACIESEEYTYWVFNQESKGYREEKCVLRKQKPTIKKSDYDVGGSRLIWGTKNADVSKINIKNPLAKMSGWMKRHSYKYRGRLHRGCADSQNIFQQWASIDCTLATCSSPLGTFPCLVSIGAKAGVVAIYALIGLGHIFAAFG